MDQFLLLYMVAKTTSSKFVTNVVGTESYSIKSKKKIDDPEAALLWKEIPKADEYKEAEPWCNLKYQVPKTKTRFEEWFMPCALVPKTTPTMKLTSPPESTPYIKIVGEEQGYRDGKSVQSSMIINLPQMNYDYNLPKTSLQNAQRHTECALIAVNLFDQLVKTVKVPTVSKYNISKQKTPSDVAEAAAMRLLGSCLRPANV